MIFKRINDDTPEQVFIVAKNSYSTSQVTNGMVVQWDYVTDGDGVSITKAAARAAGAGFPAAGVVAQTITAGSYGLIQVYGYHSAVRVRAVTGGANPIVVGNPLAINVAGSVFLAESFNTGADQVLVFPFAFALEAYSSFTSTTKAAFIKAL